MQFVICVYCLAVASGLMGTRVLLGGC